MDQEKSKKKTMNQFTAMKINGNSYSQEPTSFDYESISECLDITSTLSVKLRRS
jgi:hypothetical protein